MLPDRSLLDAIAVAVTYPLVGDRGVARSAADNAVEWMAQHEDVAGEVPAGWLAAVAVERALAAPIVPDRTHDAERRRLVGLLADQPIAARVSFALVGLCGYDPATAARLSRRSVDDVELLLAPFRDVLDGVPRLRDEPEPASVAPQASVAPEPDPAPPAAEATPAHPPPPPPWEQRTDAPVSGGIWTTPPNESAIDELLPPTAPRRRRFPVSAGTTASLLAVVALIVLITVPHGERPTFAEGSRLPTAPADQAACTGATDRSARLLDLGGGAAPARFFLPPGSNSQVPLLLLIGDAGQSADEITSTSGLEGVAATQGFAVLTLDGTAKEWNVAGVADRSDDVALVQTAIDAAAATGCVDGGTTVLVGFGRGGHLAAVAACRDTARIAGLVMIRGAYLPAGCAPTRPLPVLIEADTTDSVTPFDGGWGSSSPSDPTYTPTGVEETREGWAGISACDTTEDVTTEPSGVVVTTRTGCGPGSSVVSRVSTGYGHAWPNDVAPVLAELVARVA